MIKPLSINLSQSNGNTLLEMIVVVALIGLIGSMAVPTIGRVDHDSLERAVANTAGLVRLAREEARRSDELFGIEVDRNADRIRVFRLDQSTNPGTKVFDVYHPMSKQLAGLQTNQSPYRDIQVAAMSAAEVGACSDLTSFVFDKSGMTHCVSPTTSRLENITLELVLGEQSPVITVDPYTGRVQTAP